MSVTLLYPRCAGLDVHKATVVACLMITAASGKLSKEIRTFATTTAGLLALADWLKREARDPCRDGVNRRVTFVRSLLSSKKASKSFWSMRSHMKAVPGKKTDTDDVPMDC